MASITLNDSMRPTATAPTIRKASTIPKQNSRRASFDLVFFGVLLPPL
jgi:hypothetical protein